MSVAWLYAGLDPEPVAAELRRRFPGVCTWRGEFTGQWWAMTLDRFGRYRLIEADHPAELGRLLEAVRGRPRPRPRPVARDVRPERDRPPWWRRRKPIA